MAGADVASTRDPKARYDIGALDQRVLGLEQAVQSISSQIGALSTKLDERGRTQWPTLITAGAFLLAITGGLGTLALRPIEANQMRHEHRLDKLEDRYIADLQRTIDRLMSQDRRVDPQRP